MQSDRTSEWFVPKFGPRNFRISVGILFLPYTIIVTCFAAWGALSAGFDLERLVSVCIIYFLSVGVSAHCFDAVGGKTKPWGDLPKRKMLSVGVIALGIAFTIGLYYAFLDSPLLFPIGIVEGFFLFAYNFELFGGRFHNNASTVLSWGILPVFAGSALQANSISAETILLSAASAAITYCLIVISRRYKNLKRAQGDPMSIKRREIFLKVIFAGVVCYTLLFVFLKI